MYKDNSFLAIIPARGGSKRLPRKNTINLAGKPLIVWTIEAGLNSKYIDCVVVSSDDQEILSVSKKNGVSVIKRASELASDTASTIDVVKHVIKNIEKEYDYIVLLQPTSPLRSSSHIDEAIQQLESLGGDALISVSEMDHSPLWSNTLPENLDMSKFLRPEIKNLRSQDLEKYYRINGAIYICKVQRLMEEDTFFIQNNLWAYIMPKMNSIDIDDQFDLNLADYFLRLSAKETQ